MHEKASNIVYYVPERGVHSSPRHFNRYPTGDGKQSATRRALFTDQHNIDAVVDHLNNKLKSTRACQRKCFRYGKGGYFHASDHTGVICNAKYYSFTLQT